MKFDELIFIILIGGIFIFCTICPVIAVLFEQYKIKAMLKKYPLLNHYVVTYNEIQDKEIEFYNTFIAPTNRKIYELRDKIPIATINEHKEYSRTIEELQNSIKEYVEKDKQYNNVLKDCRNNIKKLSTKMDKIERFVLKETRWIDKD